MRSSAVAKEVMREQITEDHAIAVHDWRARSAKTDWKKRTAEMVETIKDALKYFGVICEE